jgi:molybdopterin converting factor small subunit
MLKLRNMDVTILFFGGIKEALGVARLTLQIPFAQQANLEWLLSEVCRVDDRIEALIPGLRLALNESFLDGVGASAFDQGVALTSGDVVAFIPPVCGG